MSQPLRIDFPTGVSSFITRRVRNSQLVYANNNALEERILGSLGKYQAKYNATIYAYTIFGSHDHPMMGFPPGTKSAFFRDFGARTAEAIKKYVPNFGTGAVFEKRTSEQAITADKASHLDRLMYTVLQPIAAGLCKNLSDYPGYNSFKNILSGKPLEVKFFNGDAFRRAKKRNKNVDPEQFYEIYYIKFSRLPGYENLTQKQYRRLLLQEFEKRRRKIVEEFEKQGHKWPSIARLRSTKPVEMAKNPKRTKEGSRTPLVLSVCMLARQAFLDHYFSTLVNFKKASCEYLKGNRSVEFPIGTCIPPSPFLVS